MSCDQSARKKQKVSENYQKSETHGHVLSRNNPQMTGNTSTEHLLPHYLVNHVRTKEKTVSMSKRNQQKLTVLAYLVDVGETTSHDLTVALDLELHTARMYLLRYYRMGPLQRRSVNGPEKRYAITPKGAARRD